MFTGFDFGIDTADVMGQVTALLSNGLVVALVGGVLALMVAPTIMIFLRSIVSNVHRAGGALDDPRGFDDDSV